MTAGRGIVYLVGAGPGDPGLITVHGRRLLEQADVVVHDRLVGDDLLAYARADAEIIDVREVCGHGQRAQSKIDAVLVNRAGRGCTVVRLKGGDPFVFGRGWEEWQACRDAGVPCIVIPGVTSALAVPGAMGIPTTHRGTGRAFAVVAAQGCAGDDEAGLDYQALAKINTVIILMGRSNLSKVTRLLIEGGRDPDTPAACVQRGTTPRQRSVVATLGTIAEIADRDGLQAPVVTVVGEVARCAKEYADHLGSAGVPLIEQYEPLVGRRVVITRSSSSSPHLREHLSAAGAITIEAPMIRVDYPAPSDALGSAIGNLKCCDWIAFTSVHGVRGFFEGLIALGKDARALSGCKVAAIGPITASALRKRGISPELVAEPYSAAALANGILHATGDHSVRVLCPRGNIGGGELPQALCRDGVTVEEVVTYHTVSLTPSESVLRAIGDGVDAVVLCSPASARRFAQLSLDIADAVVACMGKSTASAARKAGLTVGVVAEEPTDAGLIDALLRHFRAGPILA